MYTSSGNKSLQASVKVRVGLLCGHNIYGFFATKIFVASPAGLLNCVICESPVILSTESVKRSYCFTIKSFVSHVSSPYREEQLYTRKFM